MERRRVDSTSILEIGYEEQFATLEVMFADGKVYQYFDVPRNVYENLVIAPSIGKFFHVEIRGIYRFARV